MTKKIKFVCYTKDSKNCCRYEEVPDAGQPPVLNQLYVQRWFAQDAKALTVTIDIPEVQQVNAQSVRETLIA